MGVGGGVSRNFFFLRRDFPSSIHLDYPCSPSQLPLAQILTNLRNASSVWGVSSAQYRACADLAVEYLKAAGVEGVDGGKEGGGEEGRIEREIVARMEGLRI